MSKEYRSDSLMFKNFLETTIWTDIDHEIDMWLEGIRDALENIEDKNELLRLQGSAQAMRLLKAIPSGILENIKEDEENDRKLKEEKKDV